MAIFAVLSPAMTLVTSCGILWNIGLPFSNILIVVLFLIIIIGVDDSFFILAAWRHSKFYSRNTNGLKHFFIQEPALQ
ncbi:Patched domain-containing protein [Dirofilaria immitis]